ncbi:hypothetical protein IEQ34_007974 [Dendrobium chrysotoxum]|uniref:Glycosyltransferase N-terminal domain-containing protein n=1 Tax=Dendrobium chrysotoxum TaxID=161865 RepID=A0AAV7H3A7_DENCH|nr:hypothetical protein IEQ34_007974 [Dendrobium chrysotoxum]
MSFAGLEAAAIPNVESYKFYSTSAAFLCEAEQLRMQGTDLDELFSPEFRLFTARRRKHEFKSSGLIINTCREVEKNFLEILATREAYSSELVSAVGPLNPVPINITETEFSPGIIKQLLRPTCAWSGWTGTRLALSCTYLSPRLQQLLRSKWSSSHLGFFEVGIDFFGSYGMLSGLTSSLPRAVVGCCRLVSRRRWRGGEGGEGMGAAAGRVGPLSHGRVHEPLRVELVHGGDELQGCP